MMTRSLLLLACLISVALTLESDWNQATRDEILDIHNEYRRNEGACQMNKMVYDMELEQQARVWAERCIFKHEMKKGRGENLAWNSAHIEESQLITQAAKSWFDEKKRYRYGQRSCSSSAACHYTQMVWANTTNVGCYSARCPNLRYAYRDAWYLVCFYSPMGNWVGQKPYERSCDSPCLEGRTEENGLCVSGGTTSSETGGDGDTQSGGEEESTTQTGGEGSTQTGDCGGGSKTTTTKEKEEKCEDGNENCSIWAAHNECKRNPGWMLKNCKKSCNSCGTATSGGSGSASAGCKNNDRRCPAWAARGECSRSPGYMLKNCKLSCKRC